MKPLNTHAPDSGVDLGGVRLHTLIYANDLALLAHDREGLQRLLDHLHIFTTANGLTVNVQKPEIVVFGSPGRRWRPAGSRPPGAPPYLLRGRPRPRV